MCQGRLRQRLLYTQIMKDSSSVDTQYLHTVFDRQVRIEGWNQKLLSSQTLLCLGAGGLGSIVIINLLRLGVKKIIVIDYDKVDNHNLNRQLLYGIKDVGKPKVESCLRNAWFHNVGGTQVVGFQGCVLENWQKVVQFAKESHAVFNMIDYGDWFDLACQSLCLKLKLPMIQGGTFGVTMTVDSFSPSAKPCVLCLNGAPDKEILQRITQGKILEIDNLKFLPKNNNPVGRSFVGGCAICGEYMVCIYLNALLFNQGMEMKTQRALFYTNTLELVNFPLEKEKGCRFCGSQDTLETSNDTSNQIQIPVPQAPQETQDPAPSLQKQASNPSPEALPNASLKESPEASPEVPLPSQT